MTGSDRMMLVVFVIIVPAVLLAVYAVWLEYLQRRRDAQTFAWLESQAGVRHVRDHHTWP